MENSDSSFQDRLLEFAKKNLLVLGLFFAGLILLGVGLIQITGQRSAEIKFEKGDTLGLQGQALKKIKVDVEGEVIKPGVYELSSDARVQDALIAAGGITSNANRNLINLAAKIADGQKIYVPAEGEAASASSLGGSVGSGDLGKSGLISVNSGSQAELESLPAIGPVTAQKIINARPYGSIEELLSKKAVGKATYEKIKQLIAL